MPGPLCAGRPRTGEPVGTRRQARERALSLLYEADAKSASPADVLDDLPIDPDPFAADLVSGVGEHQAEVDDFIRRFARDWSLERMPTVDRTLLRMGVYELLYRPDVPTGGGDLRGRRAGQALLHRGVRPLRQRRARPHRGGGAARASRCRVAVLFSLRCRPFGGTALVCI